MPWASMDLTGSIMDGCGRSRAFCAVCSAPRGAVRSGWVRLGRRHAMGRARGGAIDWRAREANVTVSENT